jgi:outer membrane protein assembly factor BamD
MTAAQTPAQPAARTTRQILPALALLMAGMALSGCKSLGGDDKPVYGSPEQIYSEAAGSLKAGNYKGAAEKLELLESRYPFSNPAKQGQLDLMYAYYKNYELESAVDQADQFIRENPTHPRVDYAYYIRGLVYFESGANWLERVFRADVTQRPPGEARKSLQAFKLLVERYPKSPYAADARQRMVYLRNRLADYELAVARYYVKRGAYVGAVNRAREVIQTYDGSPAALEALQIMSASYEQLGLPELAALAANVYTKNQALPAIPPGAGAGLAMTASGQPDADWRDPNEAARTGRWEARAGVILQNSSKTDFKGGTTVDVASGAGFVAGVDYNFSERLSAGASLSYDSKNYTAEAAGDDPGETFKLKGDLTTLSLMFDGTYNFLTGPLTPFVSAGLGWTSVDTNIATGPPDVGCWWNPWYGYICTSSQDTKTESGFAYELGLGLRYDINEYLVADGLYKMKWVSFDNAEGTPSYDGFQMNLGWKF